MLRNTINREELKQDLKIDLIVNEILDKYIEHYPRKGNSWEFMTYGELFNLLVDEIEELDQSLQVNLIDGLTETIDCMLLLIFIKVNLINYNFPEGE